MGNTIVRDRQNLMDVAVQHSGNIEAAFDLAVLNNISVTDGLGTGKNLQSVNEENKRKVNLYKKENVIPAVKDITEAGKMGGIGYMQVGTDFIIS